MIDDKVESLLDQGHRGSEYSYPERSETYTGLESPDFVRSRFAPRFAELGKAEQALIEAQLIKNALR